jgi:disulfide bond formation protein DsbB
LPVALYGLGRTIDGVNWPVTVDIMSVEQVQIFTSILAIAALGGSIGLWVLRLCGRFNKTFAELARSISESALVLAAVVAVGATLGSLYFSEIANYTPCKLCWWQRIAMFPLSIVLTIAAVRKDRNIRFYVLPVAVLGLCVSVYHYIIEWFPTLEKTACDLEAPCTQVWFRTFGFSSLAFMAGCGFIAIVTLLLCSRQPLERD